MARTSTCSGREPHIYGTTTLAQINERLALWRGGVELDLLQSNHEGVLVDKLHACIDSVVAHCSTPPAGSAWRAAARRHRRYRFR
jgi:3-dehydroquinate dehydratase-2